ncbi:uncharacterized protein [Primulina eburnea]|uniref:uncharacterized protein isoform X2 n=1 Tax=Primulina eburnea TaxID=1245227 RepID=UPI003C6BF0B6
MDGKFLCYILMDNNLPFKIGDLAEARTFEHGYRGAWFRCKIIEISTREGNAGHISEYYDFPDEKLEWTEFYQTNPYRVGRTRERKELMLRPPYPPFYSKSQMPLVSEISEVTVIVDEAWKVGDLVDWWTTDCYWSGRIEALLGDCKATLKLRRPPHGEGKTYEVLYKDLRPSLDWSPQRGWTVPTQGGKHGRVCARIIEPLNQMLPFSKAHKAGQETMSDREKDESKDKRTPNIQTQGSEDRRMSETSNTQRRSSEDRRTSEQSDDPHKEHGAGGRVALNSVETNTLEATIMDLEELVCKVKWIKKILGHGVSFSDSVRPEWEFVDKSPASSAPK